MWIPELEMYYYKARVYSYKLGRFMQTDPIGYEDQFNLYAYVGNDPINGVDPTGTFASRINDRRGARARDDWLEKFNSLDSADQAKVADEAAKMGIDLGEQAIGKGLSSLNLAASLGGKKARGKGERNRTAKPSGTNSPFIKLKKHPTREGWVQYKDQNGKTKEKKGTPEELEYLGSKGARPNDGVVTEGARMFIPLPVAGVMCLLAHSTCAIVDVDGDNVLTSDDIWNY